MKKLFIYYSETKNGDAVANFLKNNDYDIEKINAKKLPKSTFLKLLVGGFKASVGIKDKIDDLSHDIHTYDEIAIGSPIWNSRICSPVRGLLNKYNFKSKQIKFILYSGSGKANAAVKFINKNYTKSDVIVLKEPKNNKEKLNKILK